MNHHLEVGLEVIKDPAEDRHVFAACRAKRSAVGQSRQTSQPETGNAARNKADADLRGDCAGWAFSSSSSDWVCRLVLQVGDKRSGEADANGAIAASVVFSDQLLQTGQKVSYPFTLIRSGSRALPMGDGKRSNRRHQCRLVPGAWVAVAARPLWSATVFHGQLSWAIAIVLRRCL